MKKTQDIQEQLREIILADGRSLNSLAHEIGIERAGLSRFVNRRRGISFHTAARLAAFFGLELRPVKKVVK